jgi:hypothetical protein
MKHYRAGQFFVQNEVLYRAKRREPGAGCSGCVLNNLISCPNIGTNEKPVACSTDDIIFVKV